jgi:hypothetical protein
MLRKFKPRYFRPSFVIDVHDIELENGEDAYELIQSQNNYEHNKNEYLTIDRVGDFETQCKLRDALRRTDGYPGDLAEIYILMNW